MAKTAAELFKEREKRVNDAIELKVPDRIPFFMSAHFFPARYVGMTYEEAYNNQEKWLEANWKVLRDFEPDIFYPPNTPIMTSGYVYETLGMRQIKWPGHGVGANKSFQFVEGEYMKAEEYDEFLDDPSDFAFRTYMPRIFEALEGFKTLPPMKTFMMGYVGAGITSLFALPPVSKALEALTKAAADAAKWEAAYSKFNEDSIAEGFVPFCGPIAIAPFDLVSDMLRGMRGAMMDMYRCPDKLLAAQEKLMPMIVGPCFQAAEMSGIKRVFIPLHRGADGFMSNKQFETFYWPFLKRLMLDLIDGGLTPCPFFEGCYEERLEYLSELPKGKIMGTFDRSDMVRVKEVLGDTMCIAGDMPVALLQTGTSEDVKEYAKKLIDVVGKDGGFIMSSNTVLDETDPKLVKEWVDFTREYGRY